MRLFCFRAVVGVVVCLIGSCSDDSTGPSAGPLQGQFADEIVEGLSWSSGGASGLTDDLGRFTYKNGDNVRFAVGDIVLGEGRGVPWMTPVAIVAGASDETHPIVANIARFLQSIDDDDNLGDGIEITDAIRAAAAGQSVDFTLPTSAFGTDPGVLQAVADMTTASTAGQRPLRAVQVSQTQLGLTLLGIYSGRYEGEVRDPSGVPLATFTFDLAALGSLSGVYQTIGSSPVAVTGSINTDGSLQASGAGGTDFIGMVSYPGDPRVAPVLTMTGGWFDTQGQASGNFEGTRTGGI